MRLIQTIHSKRDAKVQLDQWLVIRERMEYFLPIRRQLLKPNEKLSRITSRRETTASVTNMYTEPPNTTLKSYLQNSNLAANSQILSIPIILFGCMHWAYLEGGYGSARSRYDIKVDKFECPLIASPLVRAATIWPGNACPCVGGTRPLWTAEADAQEKEKHRRVLEWSPVRKLK